MSNSFKLHSFAVITGITTLTAQIVLMREFYAVFYGNESCFGILLAIWLLCVAAGSFIAVFINSQLFKQAHFNYFLQFLFFVSVFLSVFAIKLVRFFLKVPYGEYITSTNLAGFAFLVLVLPCMLAGMMFTFLSGLSRNIDKAGNGIAGVYVFEALGSTIAGLLTSLFLFRFFVNLQVLLIVFSLCFVFLVYISHNKALLVFTILLVGMLLSPLLRHFYKMQMQHYWQMFGEGMNYIDGTQSRYGELSVIDWAGDYFLYNNGTKLTQLPDIIGAQEQAALIINQHPNPQKILMIGGAFSGLLNEVGRYTDFQITCIEQNRDAFELSKQYTKGMLDSVVEQENIKLLFTDGRRFIERENECYDLIVVQKGAPATGESNRYYTREFFKLVYSKLNRAGILVIDGFPSAENYLGDELLQLNAGLYQDLRTEFKDILVLPGDQAIFFASGNLDVLQRNPQTLAERYQERGVTHDYFFSGMFLQYLMPQRIADLDTLLSSADVVRANHDFSPIAYYYDYLLWDKIQDDTHSLLKWLIDIPFSRIQFSVLTFGFILLVCIAFAGKGIRTSSLGMLVMTYAGFAGMALELLLIFAFQVLYGYIYEWIGLTIGIYMLGLVIAAQWMRKYTCQKWLKKVLFFYFILLILLIGLMWPIILISGRFDTPLFFLFIVFASGAFTGGFFPGLCSLASFRTEERTGGYYYAADVLGGAAGALTVSGILIPLYGFINSLLVLFIGGLVSLLLFLYRYKLYEPCEE